VQLDILVAGVDRDRVVHDFVDHDVVNVWRLIRLAKSWLGEVIPLSVAVARAAQREAIRLRPVMHRVQHSGALGIDEPHRSLAVQQLKTELGRRDGNPVSRCKSCALGEGEFLFAD
jgi:hypothetical protein